MIISAPKLFKLILPVEWIQSTYKKWFSTVPSKCRDSSYRRLSSLFLKRQENQTSFEIAIVSALKTCSSHSSQLEGQKIHCFILKCGLDNNIFINNSLINFYVKCGQMETACYMFESGYVSDLASWNIMLCGYVKAGRLHDAQSLFVRMPERDCVSFTTMIMGFSRDNFPGEASNIFSKMMIEGVSPNEVTMASLLTACSRLGNIHEGDAYHGIAVKRGLKAFILVSTTLVHMYAVCSHIEDAQVVFNEMHDRNIFTWNAMLNGYTKAGLIKSAEKLFEKMAEKDLVSWSTMIDGYVRAQRLSKALMTYSEMVRESVRPNEVTFTDLISACGKFSRLLEGQQIHTVILKTGLANFTFLQTAIIHFYATCEKIELAYSQFEMGLKDNASSWNALISGFVRNNKLSFAEKMFQEMPERDVVTWSSMIAGYAQNGKFKLALDTFRDMQLSGFQPNEITLSNVLSAIANAGTLEQGCSVHDFIHQKCIPHNDNLSAGIMNMYAKCGSISNALKVFWDIKDKISSISPWNAIICGLAMHGHADMCLNIFSRLLKTDIKPNSITFIGVLSACCHAGLVVVGKQFFECMKRVYDIEPNIKHYGCMVDLLGRAGLLEEAEHLIDSMPMEADVVIWGSILAASKTHRNVQAGERALEKLARLEPIHGGGRTLLSNIYAEAGRWDDVIKVRREMQLMQVEKLPGSSSSI